jgi:hypothetical protein
MDEAPEEHHVAASQRVKAHASLMIRGAPSILDIAISQPRFHSSTVHLLRRFTIIRLFLITAS